MFLPAFPYTNVWVTTQIGSYFSGMNKKRKYVFKQAPISNIYIYIYLYMYTSNTLSIGNPVRSLFVMMFCLEFFNGNQLTMTRRLRYLQKLQQCFVHRVYQRFQSDVEKMPFFGRTMTKETWIRASISVKLLILISTQFVSLLASNMFSCSQSSLIWKVSVYLGGHVVTHASLRVVTRRTKTTSSSASWCETSGGSSRRIKALPGAIFEGNIKWWSKSLKMASLSKSSKSFFPGALPEESAFSKSAFSKF